MASSNCLALRSVWWMLPWAITGGPVVSLHVILQLRDSPQGKVIVYQEVPNPSAISCQDLQRTSCTVVPHSDMTRCRCG